MEKKVVHLESEHLPSSFTSSRSSLLKIFAKTNDNKKTMEGVTKACCKTMTKRQDQKTHTPKFP
jgi:hypothetical protein